MALTTKINPLTGQPTPSKEVDEIQRRLNNEPTYIDNHNRLNGKANKITNNTNTSSTNNSADSGKAELIEDYASQGIDYNTGLGTNTSGIPSLNDEELRKFLDGALPHEREELIDKIEKSGGNSIKTAYYGYAGKEYSPEARTSTSYRRSLNSLIEKYATPHDLYGISGMPAIFLDNTDPSGRGDQRTIGYNYLLNNVIYGSYVAFKPGYIEWDITDAEGNDMESGNVPVGIVGKMFTGTLAANRPQVDQVYRDINRMNRIAAYMMNLDDVAFPFALNTIGLKQEDGGGLSAFVNNKGNQGGYRSFKGNFLFTSTTGKKKNIMTAEAYRSIGQGLASLVVNRMESPAMASGVELGDSGFLAFRIHGNIEFQDNISNMSGENPIKALADSLLGNTDDLVKYFAGRFGLNPHKDGAGALAYIVGNPMLPKVWQESGYPKAYSFDMIFSTPYGNNLSIMMNIVYPINKIAALALPLGIGGFQTSPPICRVFSAGVINTEYGLISGLAITKNMKTLSDNGMPTEVTVNVQVEDLNAFLYKEKAGWFNASVKLSTGYSIFLATLIGQNFSTISGGHRQRLSQQLIKAETADNVASMALRTSYYFKDAVGSAFTPFFNYKESISMRWTKLNTVLSMIGSDGMKTFNQPQYSSEVVIGETNQNNNVSSLGGVTRSGKPNLKK